MSIQVTYPFDTPANYTIVGDGEVAGSQARLAVDADSSFLAAYETDGDPNAIYTTGGAGSEVGTLDGTADVVGGELDIVASTDRVSYDALGTANPGEVGTIRVNFKPLFAGAGAVRTFIAHGELAGGSEHQILVRVTSAGTLQAFVHNAAGAEIGRAIVTGISWVAGQSYEIEVSWDTTAGIIDIWRDGVNDQDTFTPEPRGTLTAPSLTLGALPGSNQARRGQYEYLQVFDGYQHTPGEDYTPAGMTLLYPLGPISILPTTLLQAEDLVEFAATLDDAAGPVAFMLQKSGVNYWHNGTAWVVSDGSFAQANTAADVNANAAAFLDAIDTIRWTALLGSTTGLATPTVDEITLSYDFGAAPPSDTPACELYGFVRDVGGQPVAGAVVTARVVPEGDYREGAAGVHVLGTVTATTDAQGRFDLKVVQGLTVRIEFEDADGERIRFDHATYGRLDVTVPAQDFAALTDLLP